MYDKVPSYNKLFLLLNTIHLLKEREVFGPSIHSVMETLNTDLTSHTYGSRPFELLSSISLLNSNNLPVASQIIEKSQI